MKRKILPVLVISLLLFSCKKDIESENKLQDMPTADEQNRSGHLKLTKTFSSDVVTKWLNMQLDMLRVPLAPGTGTQGADRAQAYCGIAAYESVVPGMPNYRSLEGQLKDFPVLPDIEKGKAYHWAASANAALADMNRKLFPTTSAANKTKIDSLETALQTQFATETNDATLQRSIAFGKEIAAKVFAWAATDGSANVNPPYVPAPEFIGPAFWVQSLGPGNILLTTPPNLSPSAVNPYAANPYASQRRLLVPGVSNGVYIQPLPPYSTHPASRFYAIVKDVYDKSQSLTPEQTAAALYTRDGPGYPGGGTMVATLSQVIEQSKCNLDVAALAYAKTGIAQHEASVILFTLKYKYNVVRPINYIRDVLGHKDWVGLFNTPGHPEFPSGHATVAAAVTTALTDVFGRHFHFTLHTYDFVPLPPRSFNSLWDLAKEQSNARVWAGIHYQVTCDRSLGLGYKVSTNVLRKVKFLKDDEHDNHHGHHNPWHH